jgi:hypothetical protein
LTPFVQIAVIAVFGAAIVSALSWYSQTIRVVIAEALTGDYRFVKVNGAGIGQTVPAGHRLVVHTGPVTVRRNSIVLWSPDGGARLLVGRVAGVPGDTVNASTRQTLAAGEYWVRLDRFHPGAVDSTVAGPIARKAIIGVGEYEAAWTLRFQRLGA